MGIVEVTSSYGRAWEEQSQMTAATVYQQEGEKRGEQIEERDHDFWYSRAMNGEGN